ncbi:MAG: hypothetical protein K9N48_00965 [Verrucomicrobia bacterium]|nr:hypothetical protein [Verrucomicrobiota bacterium]MCF7709098.1 hypothetical protein [Verrucomicrobiota bacterium]
MNVGLLSQIQSSNLSTAVTSNDIRGIKPPEPINDFPFWILIPILFITLVLVWIILVKLRKTERQVSASGTDIPLHIAALHELEAQRKFMDSPYIFCARVADIIRQYMEKRFEFHAPQRTTEEFLDELQVSELLDAPQKEYLSDFLQSCDMVKFAKYEPPRIELESIFETACRFINQTRPAVKSNAGDQSVNQDTPVQERI